MQQQDEEALLSGLDAGQAGLQHRDARADYIVGLELGTSEAVASESGGT
ncbi:unnamed protein product, partial [Protopolystoma xenopodis]